MKLVFVSAKYQNICHPLHAIGLSGLTFYSLHDQYSYSPGGLKFSHTIKQIYATSVHLHSDNQGRRAGYKQLLDDVFVITLIIHNGHDSHVFASLLKASNTKGANFT